MAAPCIVVGVDGSEPAEAAARWAGRLGVAFGADVVAVHAVGLLEDGNAGPEAPGRGRLAERVEEEWCAALTEAGARHRVELRDGPALDVLLRTIRDEGAALVVVGSRGTGGVAARSLGSTSLHLLQQTPVPALVVPPGPGPGPGVPGHVLVGVDGSAASRAALDLAVEVAAALGAEITALGVDEAAPVAQPAPVEDAVRALGDRGGPVNVVVGTGDPASALLALAEEVRAGLLALGTRGEDGPDDLVLGSVARALADRSRRPTLVVPAAAGAVGLRRLS